LLLPSASVNSGHVSCNVKGDTSGWAACTAWTVAYVAGQATRRRAAPFVPEGEKPVANSMFVCVRPVILCRDQARVVRRFM
jgi:hypothetical protein